MYKVKGICLRTTDFKEKDKILTLATFEKGKISVVCRGVRDKNAKLKSAAMPLCFGEYIINEGKTSSVVVGADIEENFFGCWSDMKKGVSAFAVLEMLEKTFPRGEDISEDTLAALRALKEITYGNIKPKAVALWYAVKILEGQGVDIEEISAVPLDLRKKLMQIRSLEASELEGMDITENDVNNCLRCGYMIFADSLNIRLNILKNDNIYL